MSITIMNNQPTNPTSQQINLTIINKTEEQYSSKKFINNTSLKEKCNEYYTQKYLWEVVEPIFKQIGAHKELKLYEAFGSNDSIESPKMLNELTGLEVLVNGAFSGGDFFKSPIILNRNTIATTNPPFTDNEMTRKNAKTSSYTYLKERIMWRFITADMPFMLILPTDTSSTDFYMKIQDHLRAKNLPIIKEVKVVGRPNFSGPIEEQIKKVKTGKIVWSDTKTITKNISIYLWNLEKFNIDTRSFMKNQDIVSVRLDLSRSTNAIKQAEKKEQSRLKKHNQKFMKDLEKKMNINKMRRDLRKEDKKNYKYEAFTSKIKADLSSLDDLLQSIKSSVEKADEVYEEMILF